MPETDPETPADTVGHADPVAVAATRWFVAMLDEQVDTARRRAFEDWREADPRHAAAYERVARLWDASGGLPELRRARPARRAVLRGLAVATLALAGAAGGGRLLLGPHPLADHATRTGERRTVRLPDGSTAMLSTASALEVAFGPQRREVRLLAGEAWFEVAADAAGRPFVVAADGGRTTALGTAFAITLADDSVAVAVTAHAVEIAAGGAVRRLHAGGRVRYRRSGIGAPEALDPAALAWRSGRLVFLSRPLGEVVAAVDRWHSGRTVLVGTELAARPVTVMIDAARAREELLRLAETLPVRVLELTPLLTIIRPI
ncbi:iron dicitrate transporter FecR [Allostella sp. ATCC 35155]|nr:iron dicitrate transporter FecR [Stella sp. ATCC 35155]